MMRASVLAALALAGSIVPASAGQEAGRPAVRFKAFCTFEREGAQLDLSNVKDAEEVLRRHADAHGWSWEILAADVVSGLSAARCPDRICQQMAQAYDLNKEGKGVFVYRAMALALDRNNRMDSALVLLERALKEQRGKEADRRSDMHVAFLSEWAAKVAAHSGDWSKALEFIEGWHSTSWCGNCAASETSRVNAFTVRCFLEAQRYEEARELARRTAQSSWIRSVGVLELWLDCEIQDGRAQTVDEALAIVLPMVPGDAAEDCRRARDDWKLARAPRSTQLEYLNDLARSHPELALPLVLSFDEAEMNRRMSAFELMDGNVREPALAYLLAGLGSPEAQAWIAKIEEVYFQNGERNPVGYLSDEWRRFNPRWQLLTEGG